MDWKTFITEIIKSLAWPVVICTAIILFKREFTIILKEFAKYPYLRLKRGENELEIGIKEVKKETKDINLPEQEEWILKSAHQALDDPKESILSAWNEIENIAKEALGVNYTQPFELEHIRKLLPEEKFKLFMKMKELRNKATHIPSQILSTSTAIDYSESALKLSNYLKDRKKDKDKDDINRNSA